MRKTKKGFTLVELLVVIAILAILASVAVVGYTSFITKADQSKVDSEANQIETYINADILAGKTCKVAEGVYVTADKTVAANADGTGVPTYGTYVTDLNGLKGTLSIKTVDNEVCLVYTIDEVSSIVLTGVTAGVDAADGE